MKKNFAIPCPLHLVKFAGKELWEGQTSPYKINERSLLGKFLYSLLIDKRSKNYEVYECESLLHIELSDTLAKRSPSPLKLLGLNQFLELQFDQALVIWVRAQMQNGSNRYQAVLSFLRYFDLETPSMIQRYYQFVKRNQNLPYRLRIKKITDEL